MGIFSTREDQNITKPETTYRQIQCTPLVDVLFISIGNRLDNVDKSTLCDIYGKIRVLDTRHECENELFSFFNKDKDNPESVCFDEPLSLTIPSTFPIIRPSKDICLDVHLLDKRADMVVASGKIILDKKGDECEEFEDIEIDGKEGNMFFARVHYTIIKYAVAATIDVLFFSKDDEFDLFSNDAVAYSDFDSNDVVTHMDEPFDEEDWVDYDERDCGDGVVANVFGTVRGRSDLKVANGKDWHPIFLFNKLASQGVQVKSGCFIQLSRSVVILPAYSSSLVVDVNLSHCEGDTPIARGSLEFKLQSQDSFKKDIVGEFEERVRVRVTWNKFYIEEIMEAMFERQESAIPIGRSPFHLLEMSSVVIHRKGFKPFSFYGKICVDDWNKNCIFDKDKNDPQICRESGALATLKDQHSHSFTILGNFLTVVDLRDAETGATISMGTVQWDDIVVRYWLDQRLCSIVRGEEGFAAVHYTTFYDGMMANLVMKLGGKHLPGYVYGTIVARYSTFEYSSAYDKKYYQIMLFDNVSEGYDRSQQSALTADSNLPLLKREVCLATGSSLIVEADLRVSSKRPFDGDSEQGTRFLQSTVELNPDCGSPVRLSDGGPCFIDVHVSWKFGTECLFAS